MPLPLVSASCNRIELGISTCFSHPNTPRIAAIFFDSCQSLNLTNSSHPDMTGLHVPFASFMKEGQLVSCSPCLLSTQDHFITTTLSQPRVCRPCFGLGVQQKQRLVRYSKGKRNEKLVLAARPYSLLSHSLNSKKPQISTPQKCSVRRQIP